MHNNLEERSSEDKVKLLQYLDNVLHCVTNNVLIYPYLWIEENKIKSLKPYHDSDTPELMKAQKPLHNINL